jgi:hypothetical protein
VPSVERAPRAERITSGPARDLPILMAEGDLEMLGLMPGASNFTFLARVVRGTSTALVVYKPRAGEAPLWDFPEGTLCQREVAASVLAGALGWPAVPPTILRDGPRGPGSVQLLVQADFDEHYFTLRETHLDQFRSIAAFDVVANNADRKGGHCLLAPDGTIWVIDHGVCFAVESKLRTVIWDFAGQPVPPRLLEDVARVADELRGGPLRDRMTSLLTPDEIEATAQRAERLARATRFPHPVGRRPYPWPPV